MNHNWADQYARQRFDQLSRDVRGDQLLRMARSDSEATSPRTFVLIMARLRLVVATLTQAKKDAVKVTGKRS